MRPCKRIEIVVERAQSEQLERALMDAGVNGYTRILNAGGSGDRGYRRADDVTDTDENCVFIIAVEDEALIEPIYEKVRPILRRFGGLCLVSDAQLLLH